ncbi:hypothetical protein [Lacticaseibacillus jixiensis]|uniref:hypothetical protein n=1 Tax=Lacticaseibacillus jixiensis TaxID=3231926 RepID=UPI0036F1D6DA
MALSQFHQFNFGRHYVYTAISTIVILLLLLGGCILISNGILGEYLVRVFLEVK